MRKGNLHRRLQKVEANSSQAASVPREIRIVFCHALDGRLAGVSVFGADGRLVWLEPPEGSEQGELVTAGEPVPYPVAA